jgi:hypothetical protein
MSNSEIKVGQVYQHYKGNHYRILALGKHSESGEELVTYQRQEDDHVYSRPKNMFFDEIEKDGIKTTRFVLTSNSSKRLLTEICGWYGVAALLCAYFLLSFNVLSSKDLLFQVLNVTGAIGIVIDALAQRNWQPAVLNIVWAVIGAIALIAFII